jgi:hypothetical protein
LNVWDQLAYPFPKECIHWRVGATTKDKSKGIPLAYLDARDVMDRLDQVIGPGNWSDTYEETATGRVFCKLAIRIEFADGKTVIVDKSDAAGNTDVEGEKGAVSDAFKRAAVKFGIGRYLYRLGTQWVPIKPAGRSHAIAGDPPTLPPWALPGGPPAPTAYTGFPSEEGSGAGESEDPKTTEVDAGAVEDGQGDTGDVVDFEYAKRCAKMLEEFAALQERGIKRMGLEEYTKTVNTLLETGYGGTSWKDEDIDLDVAKKMYIDISKAIESYQGGTA